MAIDVELVLHEMAIRGLVNEPGVRAELMRQGKHAADASRAKAPKETGAGAASIHAESTIEMMTPEVHISWDKEHYYMYFHQRGTRFMSAHPFMTFGRASSPSPSPEE